MTTVSHHDERVTPHRPIRVVISQPMLFPWVGLLEQVRLADAFVYYDDVQYSKGSFTNRVQLKAPSRSTGTMWMTIPLRDQHLGQTIASLKTREDDSWRARHRDLFAQVYAGAPFLEDAMSLLRGVHRIETDSVASLVIASMEALSDYFDLWPRSVHLSSRLGVPGKGSDRVLAIVQRLGGGVYVTGHGARNYLEHERFERAGVRVDYMKYAMSAYPQQHGLFTPFVSALDLVANVGKAGRAMIASGAVPWKEFVRS